MGIFKKNLSLKFLSLILAIFIWIIIINVSKPEVSDSKNVELEILNQDVLGDQDKIWELNRNTVSVTYTARTDQLSNITAADFRAYIDLNDYSITGSVPVYIEVLNGKESLISNVSSNPSVIRVTLEDIQEKQFDLNIRQIGIASEGYSVYDISLSTDTITLTGPESSIGRISEVGVNIDVSGINGNTTGVSSPIFYDANGNTINGLNDISMSTEEISYSVTVHKKKTINVIISTVGTVAQGYMYESMTISPESIQLSSTEDIIDSMSSLTLPDIDITGANATITHSFQIQDYLPSGVELSEANSEINVTVRISERPEIETQSTTISTEETETSTSETTEEVESTEEVETREEETEETREEETSLVREDIEDETGHETREMDAEPATREEEREGGERTEG